MMEFYRYESQNSKFLLSRHCMTKRQKKEMVQKSWGLLVGKDIPLVLIRDDIDAHLHYILKEIIDGIAAIGIQLAVELPSEAQRQKNWELFCKKHPKWIRIIDEEESQYEIFDLALLEDLTIDRIKSLKEKRMVPVAEKGVSTFDPIHEKGNGFLFHENPWSLFAALVRAQETYRFPYDWENLIKAVSKLI